MLRPGRTLLAMLCLVLIALSAQPPNVARGAEGPVGATVVGDEIPAAPELAAAADLPETGRREIGYLNGRFLILNMHGALFHADVADFNEDIAYAS